MRLRADTLLFGALLTSCAAAPKAAPPLHVAPAPRDDAGQTGLASWYGEELRGSRTANGERFDPDGISAAHRSLPLGSYADVTALDTGKTIRVRINDRGPYHSNRVLDLSLGAARKLGLTGHGARTVHIRRIDRPDAVRTEIAGNALDRLRGRTGWRAPARQVASATMPASAGPWFIQVASFSKLSRARSLASTLGGDVMSAGSLHRVRIGPFASFAKANAALAPLTSRGYPDGQITR